MAKIAVALVVAAAALVAGSAQQIPSCATSLIPCVNYLNSTSPPPSCCGPLKEAVKTQAPCLCGLFNDTALLKAFNIDLKQVLQLPKACGISANRTTLCSKVSATAPATAPTGPAPASSSPPGPAPASSSPPGPARASSSPPGPAPASSLPPGPAPTLSSPRGPTPASSSSAGPAPALSSSPGPAPASSSSPGPAPASSSSPAPAPAPASSLSPGPTPVSSSPPGNKSNSAHEAASIGFPALTGLLLFLWSMMA